MAKDKYYLPITFWKELKFPMDFNKGLLKSLRMSGANNTEEAFIVLLKEYA